MQTIQAIQAEAFAMNPGYFTKVRAEADKIAADMQAIADEGETYEVQEYQGGRLIVVMIFGGKVEFVL